MRSLLTLIPALAITATGLFMVDAQIDASHAATLPHTACPTEDSNFCVWDARHEGNGRGHSFWVSKSGKVHFISHRRAHHMIH